MLTDEKISQVFDAVAESNHCTEMFDYLYARAIEAAVREELAKQEPVCFFNGYYGGRVVVEMLNPRVVYPIGTALYAAPVVQPDKE